MTRALIADPRGAGVIAIVIGAHESHGVTLTRLCAAAQRLRQQPFDQRQVERRQTLQVCDRHVLVVQSGTCLLYELGILFSRFIKASPERSKTPQDA